MGLLNRSNEPEYEVDPDEHTHENGVTHSHEGGQTPHTHDCICVERRDRQCKHHGG
tara:strand:+ start:389 stop:556 length:168 start_codon:yes stop_codon:yes gene_type:complete